MKVIHLSKEEATHILRACFHAGISTSVLNELHQEVQATFKVYYNGHTGEFEKERK